MQQRRLPVIFIALLLSILAYFSTTLVSSVPQAQAHVAHEEYKYAAYHAYVIGSDPVDGSTISRVPGEVHIFFNAPISPISNAHVYAINANGDKVDVTAAPSTVPMSNTSELITTLKNPGSLPEGSYEVIWTAVASDDGYTTYGIIGFDVGYSSTGAIGNVILGPTSSNNIAEIQRLDFTALLSILWNWLVFGALIFWLGQLVIENLFLAKGQDTNLFQQAHKRTRPLEWLCLWMMLLGEVIALTLHMTRYVQASIEQGLHVADLVKFVPDTLYGYLWLARIVLIIVAMILLYREQKRQPAQKKQATQEDQEAREELKDEEAEKLQETTDTHSSTQGSKIIWFVLAGLITLFFVLTSSITDVLELHVSAVIVSWLLLVAQGIWLGGFAYLTFILLPLFQNKELEYNTETLISLLRRLTPLLLAGMGIQLFCMLFISEASISDPQQLLVNPFGRTLTVQIVLMVLAMALSLYTLCVIRPKLTRQALLLPVVKADLPTRQTRQHEMSETQKRFKLTTTLLSIAGLALLLCSALEAFYAPPIDYPNIKYGNAPSSQNGSVNDQTRLIGDLNVTFQILPGRTGYDHAIILTIMDSKGHPVTNAQVQLTTNMVLMDMGVQHVTMQGGNPYYSATFDKRAAFNMPGLWNIDVTIQRPGQKNIKGSFKITLTA
jgi:methionine-rich copper-binding protein CopC